MQSSRQGLRVDTVDAVEAGLRMPRQRVPRQENPWLLTDTDQGAAVPWKRQAFRACARETNGQLLLGG